MKRHELALRSGRWYGAPRSIKANVFSTTKHPLIEEHSALIYEARGRRLDERKWRLTKRKTAKVSSADAGTKEDSFSRTRFPESNEAKIENEWRRQVLSRGEKTAAPLGWEKITLRASRRKVQPGASS